MTDVPLRCACGALRGVVRDVSPSEVNRVVCCCGSCQRYAHHLGRAAILDEHGGTHIFQPAPGRIELTAGDEHLALLRLTPRGALRWYAACCDSPLANTLDNMRFPFVAVHCAAVDRDALDAPLDAVLGPVRARVNKRFPLRTAIALRATPWALVSMLVAYWGMAARWWARGVHRGSPFFDRVTGQPVRAPRVVDPPRPRWRPRLAGCR